MNWKYNYNNIPKDGSPVLIKTVLGEFVVASWRNYDEPFGSCLYYDSCQFPLAPCDVYKWVKIDG